MKLSEIIGALGLTVFAEGRADTVEGCYIGDLLSRVISRSTAGGVWITIMNNLNVAAVALLAEVPCILLAEGMQPMEGVAEKCREEGLWLLGSGDSAFDLARALIKLGM
jgi:hypothetical protein